MATDASGSPSTNWLIPKYLTSADAPSGKGLNAIIDYLDTLLKQKFPGFSSAITGTPSSTTYLRGDGSWASISTGPGAPATTLPGSPTDGQQAILTDSTATPTYAWLMQYSSAASKWLFIGGSPLVGSTASGSTTTSATYSDITNNITLVFPRAGSYRVRWAGTLWVKTANQTGNLAIKIAAAAIVDATDSLVQFNSAGQSQSTQSNQKTVAVSAADTVKLQAKVQGGATLQVDGPSIEVTPIVVT